MGLLLLKNRGFFRVGRARGSSYGINSIFEKGVGGAYYYMRVQQRALCACTYVCVRDWGANVLAVAAVFSCSACSPSSSVDYGEECCVRKRCCIRVCACICLCQRACRGVYGSECIFSL